MKKLILLAMALGLLLSGCANDRGSWVRKDTSPEQLQMDYRECAGQPLLPPPVPYGFRSMNLHMREVNLCMRNKGYEWKRDGQIE
jgi:hypothetical protein